MSRPVTGTPSRSTAEGRPAARLPARWTACVRCLPALLAAAALAAGIAWPGAPVRAQGQQAIGSYFSLVNTYVYEKGPRQGRRVLVRPREAFVVLDSTADDNDIIWLQIVYPRHSAKVSGTGWTPSAPHELLSAQLEPVLVFSRIPGGDSLRGVTVQRVPARNVELLNESQTGKAFARVDWQKVRYEMETPARMWVRSTTGVFRAGKPPAFLSRVYGELVTRNVEKDELVRLLSGVVHIGDTVRDVRWALGDPLRNQEETVGQARRTIWQYPELTVTFENDLVKQIN